VNTSLLAIVAKVASSETFDAVLWQDAMHRLAHNELSVRQRLVTYQRAIECAMLIGRLEEGLEALAQANRIGLIDVNWIDRCPLLRPYAAEPRWRVQRDILAARAERVLTALRSASV
jgi:hypothetical protein